MRHMITTACCLMLLAAVQGTALADPTPIPPPPPKADADVSQALTSCQADLALAVKDGAECRGIDPDKYLDTLRGQSGGTATVVVTPTKPKGKWRTRIEDVPAGNKRCPNGGTVELTGRDKNANGKLDDKEVTGRSYACKGDAGAQGPEGPAGVQGEKGDRGSDGLTSILITVKEPKGKNCPSGGQHMMYGLDGNRDTKLKVGGPDDEVDGEAYVCNGADGKSGNDGRDGYSRIQLISGIRFASIFTADRPNGWSVAPELGLKYWLSQTVEFNLGLAWAPGDDRNMVVTGQVCRRGSGSMLGLCAGGQYIGWNLEGGLALWHSGLATASVKLVPVETRHVDLEFEVGGGIGFDGYDADMQLAGSVTARGGLTVKF
jgi:hypothetical protein